MVKLVEEVQQLNRQLYSTRADIRLELIKINTELNESKKKDHSPDVLDGFQSGHHCGV